MIVSRDCIMIHVQVARVVLFVDYRYSVYSLAPRREAVYVHLHRATSRAHTPIPQRRPDGRRLPVGGDDDVCVMRPDRSMPHNATDLVGGSGRLRHADRPRPLQGWARLLGGRVELDGLPLAAHRILRPIPAPCMLRRKDVLCNFLVLRRHRP